MANFGPLSAEIGFGVWGTQQISAGFAYWLVAAATSFTRGQPNFAQFGHLLGWYTICTFSGYIVGGFCPLTEFCPVQNSLYTQLLHSPILAALLHGTPAVGVSQALRRGTRNGIMELLQRALSIFGWAAIMLGICQHSS